jgi:hypothetical protein
MKVKTKVKAGIPYCMYDLSCPPPPPRIGTGGGNDGGAGSVFRSH